MDCRVISAFTRVFDALCPAMTPVLLPIAPRADGSHARVAVFIVNNRPETMERIRPHVKVGSSHDAAVHPTLVSRAQRSASEAKWCAADPGSLRSVAVPDQRCTAPLRYALHRLRDTRYGRLGFLIPISRCQTALLNSAPRGAAPQVMASARSAVGSQGDAASSMNCGSISGCAGAMSVRIIVPSLRMKNSSGFQTPPFQAIVTRSR